MSRQAGPESGGAFLDGSEKGVADLVVLLFRSLGFRLRGLLWFSARDCRCALAVDAGEGALYSVRNHPGAGNSERNMSIGLLVGQITLGIYALLLAAGGAIGYLKAGSRASLIAGSISAVAAVTALGLSVANYKLGVPLGLILSIALFLLFGYRYAVKTRKFMPSGLLAVASLVVLAVMFVIMDWNWS
jgi:uncharacterized membrane protein (UPF0136 family)